MIKVAIDAAHAAGNLAYTYFGKVKNVRYKADNSPVTIADVNAEQLARSIITKNFPNHGIIGEELENKNPKAKYQWVIDPIDGTRQFVRGIPFWTTYIALLKNGKPILGVSYPAASGEIYTAQKGKGTYFNSKRVHVSKISKLDSAYLNHSSILHFMKKGYMNGFIKLCESVHSHSGYRDSLGYHMLIIGKTEIMIEDKDEIYDIAAPSILVEEAGGRFSDFSGKFSLTSDEAVATNGLLHDDVIRILNS